jgi:hypothetical protein
MRLKISHYSFDASFVVICREHNRNEVGFDGIVNNVLLAKYLDGEVIKPKYKKKEARTGDGLVQEGFTGSYPTVQRFVKARHEGRRHSPGTVFIPCLHLEPCAFWVIGRII